MKETCLPLASDTWTDREHEAVGRVLKSGRYTMGREIKSFEAEFAGFVGSRYALMVNSGSSANLLSVAGLIYHPDRLLSPGDEVIVPAVAWSTSFFPFHQHGISIRFVDVDIETLNIDPDLVEKAVTDRTRAILAVHLLGNPCEYDRLLQICDRHGLVLIEDCCEAMGARYQDRHVGTYGICGTFSTYFSHHICTVEGGLIVTDDEQLYHTLLSLRNHGWCRDQPEGSHLSLESDPFMKLFRFVLPGYNFRATEPAGAAGRIQLNKLPGFVHERRGNARCFKSLFKDSDSIRLQRETGAASWFGFSMILEGKLKGKRLLVADTLMREGIECRPIVAGNFLKNPVIQYLDYSTGSSIQAADRIDEDGLFVGNHHYSIEKQLRYLKEIIQTF